MKKALLTRYNYTKDGYRKRFREATSETEETPDQFVIRLKNYLAKWLEHSGSSPANFYALVDLIVKEQFINACSEDLAMYLLERGPKGLVELTTWAEKYLIAHKEQLGKSKLGDELPENQRRVLRDLVRRYPDVFTDMPGDSAPNQTD